MDLKPGYNQKAADLWMQMIQRLGAAPETIINWQADLALEPEFSQVLIFAADAQKEEYEYIYQTCLYNLQLQQECDARKMEIAKSFQDGWADRALFDDKFYLEEDMEEILNSSVKKHFKPVMFFGILPRIAGSVLSVLTFFIFLLWVLTSGGYSGYGFDDAAILVLVFGYLLAMPATIVGTALIFSYYLIPDLIYNVAWGVLTLAAFLVGVMTYKYTGGQIFVIVFYFVEYYIFYVLVPIIYLIVSMNVIKKSKSKVRIRKKSEKMNYEDLLKQYSEVLYKLNGSFASQLDFVQADCEGRKHHATAALYNNTPEYFKEFCTENEVQYSDYAAFLNNRKSRPREA